MQQEDKVVSSEELRACNLHWEVVFEGDIQQEAEVADKAHKMVQEEQMEDNWDMHLEDKEEEQLFDRVDRELELVILG